MRISDWISDVCSSDLFLNGWVLQFKPFFIGMVLIHSPSCHHPAQQNECEPESNVEQSPERRQLDHPNEHESQDRKSAVKGKRVEVSADLGGSGSLKKKKKKDNKQAPKKKTKNT